MLQARKPSFITFDDWNVLDEIELQRGVEIGRSRVKFTTVEEMLEALGKATELVGPESKPRRPQRLRIIVFPVGSDEIGLNCLTLNGEKCYRYLNK